MDGATCLFLELMSKTLRCETNCTSPLGLISKLISAFSSKLLSTNCYEISSVDRTVLENCQAESSQFACS